jgi:hypothetical protein
VQTHHDEDLGVAIAVPDGWEVTSSDEFHLLLLAPVDHDFRANIGVSRSELDPPTPEHLAEVVDRVREERAREQRTVHLEGERPVVQDGASGWMLRSRWEVEDAPVEVIQISGMFLTPAGALFQLHCTTLSEAADTYLPVFRDVLDSLRFP